MERAAVLRVKRKRGGPVPAEALVLACKRIRTEPGGGGEKAAVAATAGQAGVEQNFFKLVATVASEDEPVQKYIQEAITKDKAARLLNPSRGSAQRIIQSLRTSKQANRQKSRYHLIASHRPNFTDGEHDVLDANAVETSEQLTSEGKEDRASHGTSDGCAEFQLFDIVQEEDVDSEMQATSLQKTDEPDVILCNAEKMIRQRLTISDSRQEAVHSPMKGEYVYDIYCMETESSGWIENIFSVQPYTQDYELVEEDDGPEEIYDDEDDENNENNWRNDYPDEEEDSERDSENGSTSDEDSGYIRRRWDSGYVRRSWDKYEPSVFRDCEYDGVPECDFE